MGEEGEREIEREERESLRAAAVINGVHRVGEHEQVRPGRRREHLGRRRVLERRGDRRSE